MQWPLCRAFSGRCTAKWPKPTACLCRAFIGVHGKSVIYCRAFCASAHGKELSLPCVFLPAHGKGRHTLSHPVAVSCFFFPCAVKNARQRLFTVRCQTRRTAKGLYRAKCYCVPFAVCPRQKTHGKKFAVRFRAFPSARALFPVVIHDHVSL
jgi:hypothetical protein